MLRVQQATWKKAVGLRQRAFLHVVVAFVFFFWGGGGGRGGWGLGTALPHFLWHDGGCLLGSPSGLHGLRPTQPSTCGAEGARGLVSMASAV